MNMMEEAKEAVEELLRNDPELYDGYHMKTAILLEEKKVSGSNFVREGSSGTIPG